MLIIFSLFHEHISCLALCQDEYLLVFATTVLSFALRSWDPNILTSMYQSEMQSRCQTRLNWAYWVLSEGIVPTQFRAQPCWQENESNTSWNVQLWTQYSHVEYLWIWALRCKNGDGAYQTRKTVHNQRISLHGTFVSPRNIETSISYQAQSILFVKICCSL